MARLNWCGSARKAAEERSIFMHYDIAFPNLGIYLDHVGKNIDIFGFTIAYYGIIIGCAILI